MNTKEPATGASVDTAGECKSYCPSCANETKTMSVNCGACGRLGPNVFPTLMAVFLSGAVLVEWYLFIWKVLPMAASVLQATGGNFSAGVKAGVEIAGFVGAGWWILLPIAGVVFGFACVFWGPMRARGAHWVLSIVVAAQVFSCYVFLSACFESLAALGSRGIGHG